MQLSLTYNEEHAARSCLGPTDWEAPRDPHPVPFGPGANRPRPVDDEDLTIREAGRILRMLDKNGNPTDALYDIFKEHGYQVGGRGDWRITRQALDRIRRIAA